MGGFVILAALAAFVLRRRLSPDAIEERVEEAPLAAPAQQATAPMPKPAMAPPPPVPPMPVAPISEEVADITLEPLGIRLSLVYATLRYRVSITAREALAPAQLRGGMIGAHSAIPADQQLSPPVDALALLKPVPALAAGETAVLIGEIQLPLNAIRPLQRGNAAYFVPLARFYLVTDDSAVLLRRVFTLGLAGENALSPLRLDAGPQEYRDIAVREVEAARNHAVPDAQPRRAVG